MPETITRARVREEYIWPYPHVRSGVWYTIRRRPDDEAGYVWLETRPSPSYVREEHFEFREEPRAPHAARRPVPERPTEAEPVGRQARLRVSSPRRYSSLVPGVWVWAREILTLVRPLPVVTPGERRCRRLPSSDFEFRDADPAGDPLQGPASERPTPLMRER